MLYLNENVEIEVVDLLSVRGIGARHTLCAGNRGKSDQFQLRYAADHGLVLLTHNRWDFRKLHEEWIAAGKTHSGILLIGCVGPTEIARRVAEFVSKRLPSLPRPFCEVAPQ